MNIRAITFGNFKHDLCHFCWRPSKPTRICKRTPFFSLLLLAVTAVVLFLAAYHAMYPQPHWGFYLAKRSKWGHIDLATEEIPLVLAWTSFFHHGDGSLMQHMRGLGVDTVECPYECEYSDDRNRYHPDRRSVFIYHSWNVDPGDIIRPATGYYLNVFFAVEPPTRAGHRHEEMPVDTFNLTMSYQLNSDLWWPYNALEPIDANTTPAEKWSWSEVEALTLRKDKVAVIFTTNCDPTLPSRRHDYLLALQQHMPISLFGGCYGKPCWDEGCMAREMDSHLFYLAFENSVCTDYITEKFWNAKRLIVPVVLSRRVQFANYPPHIPLPAFIAADDFASPKQLAEHLLHLASNRTEYLRMLEWTRHYKRTHIGVLDNEMFVSNAANLCRLCQMAHEGREATVPDINKVWGLHVCEDAYSTRVLLNQSAA